MVTRAVRIRRNKEEAEVVADRGEDVIAKREERVVIATGEAAAEEFFENAEAAEGEKEPDGEKPAAPSAS